MSRLTISERIWGILFLLLVNMSVGCSMSDIVGDSNQKNTENNPDAIKSAEGALRLYHGAIDNYASAVENFVVTSGLFGDELRPRFENELLFLGSNFMDQRIVSSGNAGDNVHLSFTSIQSARAHARMARYALEKYGAALPSALIGHLYAIEGWADVMLADLFCSGVPLSIIDVDEDGDIILKPGSSTNEIYLTAIALFDSALALTADSVRFSGFASVGKGQALLGLGEYPVAAEVVANVPNNFVYFVEGRGNSFLITAPPPRLYAYSSFTVSDAEGRNGLPYVSSGDPRTDTIGISRQNPGAPYPDHIVRKYSSTTRNYLRVTTANAIAARLIEAEAALHTAGGTDWLEILNRLRTSCESESTCAVPSPAGMGGVAGLPLLRDPALDPIPVGKTAFDVRVDLLFAERAYWLFLTGYRQGDLRRLVRNYERPENTVYPTGEYPALTALGMDYGTDVTLPVPETERERNPLFQGCIDREA